MLALVNLLQANLPEPQPATGDDGLSSPTEKPSPAKLFFRRLVAHVRDNLTKEVSSGYNTLEVNLHIAQLFHTMMQQVEPTDDDGRDAQGATNLNWQREAVKVRQTFIGVEVGAATLVLDVLADTDTEVVLNIAMLELGVKLLQFGNSAVQIAIASHLSDSPSDDFFQATTRMLREANACVRSATQEFINTENIVARASFAPSFVSGSSSSGASPTKPVQVAHAASGAAAVGGPPPPSDAERTPPIPVLPTLLIKFLQLWCEGHNAVMQELLLEQPNNKRQENVIEHVVDLLAEVCRDSQAMAVMSDTTFDLMLACLKFLLEAVQGNSARNKNYLATEDAALNATHQILIWVWTASRQRWELSALAEVQLLVFQLLAALMEGQNDEADLLRVVKHLSKRYDSRVFAMSSAFITNELVALDQKDPESKSKVKFSLDAAPPSERNEDSRRRLLDSTCELCNIYQQLAAVDKTALSDVADLVEKIGLWSSGLPKISSIEYTWGSGRVCKMMFPTPQIAQALSEKSKDKLRATLDIESEESRKHDFIARANELVVEMHALHRLAQYRVFRLLHQNFILIRFVVFSFSLFANIIILANTVGPGNEGHPFGQGMITSREELALHVRNRLLHAAFFGYLIVAIYHLASNLNVVRKRVKQVSAAGAIVDKTEREHAHELVEQPVARDSFRKPTLLQLKRDSFSSLAMLPQDPLQLKQLAQDKLQDKLREARRNRLVLMLQRLKAFRPMLSAFVFLGALAALSHSANLSSFAYSLAVFMLFVELFLVPGALYELFLQILREDAAATASADRRRSFSMLAPIASVYCVSYELLKLTDVWSSLLFALLTTISNRSVVHDEGFGEKTPYSFNHHMVGASFLMLDCITISPRLQVVLRAVINPLPDLAATFSLMIFVVFIFASTGLYYFGQLIIIDEDETYLNATTGVIKMKQAMQCPNLAYCFVQFVDVGLRSSDIVDAAFDEVTWEDGFEAYMWRVMYGLFFFLLVGVILFNIVAGIIIDKFSEMREEQERRSNFFKTTNIISGLTTNQCEEKDISFDDLNDREQNEWQYVFLLAHLKDKRPEEFSGAEEMIFSCFNCNDFSWLPHNTSCGLQLQGTGADDDDSADPIIDALAQSTEQLAGELAKVQGVLEQVPKMQTDLQELRLRLTEKFAGGDASAERPPSKDPKRKKKSREKKEDAKGGGQGTMTPSASLASLGTAGSLEDHDG